MKISLYVCVWVLGFFQIDLMVPLPASSPDLLPGVQVHMPREQHVTEAITLLCYFCQEPQVCQLHWAEPPALFMAASPGSGQAFSDFCWDESCWKTFAVQGQCHILPWRRSGLGSHAALLPSDSWTGIGTADCRTLSAGGNGPWENKAACWYPPLGSDLSWAWAEVEQLDIK